MARRRRTHGAPSPRSGDDALPLGADAPDGEIVDGLSDADVADWTEEDVDEIAPETPTLSVRSAMPSRCLLLRSFQLQGRTFGPGDEQAVMDTLSPALRASLAALGYLREA